MPREYQGDPQQARREVAIVVARYNDTVTTSLLNGALDTLGAHGIDTASVTVAWVPGAWEIPVVAQRFAQSKQFGAVICLAAVIRGETTHDQYINQQVSQSLGEISLATGIPLLFGVLTCQTLEQAIQRSGGRVGNKGSDCAQAALEMIDLLAKLPS